MRLLIFSDIHGDKAALEKLMATEADYYFAAGDLANWGRGLEQLGPILQKRGDRMYVIPGNHESESDIAGFCREYGFHDFHGQTMEIEGHNRDRGKPRGSAPPTPPDMRVRIRRFRDFGPVRAGGSRRLSPMEVSPLPGSFRASPYPPLASSAEADWLAHGRP